MRIIKSSDLSNDFYKFAEIEELDTVSSILQDIEKNGDIAVKAYCRQFDDVELTSFEVKQVEIEEAYQNVDNKIIDAIKSSVKNIKSFALKQLEQFNDFEFEINPGVFTGQRVVPVNNVCVYAPGGNFPLPSSVLMGVVPAKVAGVSEIVVCSPPVYEGKPHPAVIVAADIAGADKIYKIGGVQAIGATAYGTESINSVDLIVGPGNKYVSAAKKIVYGKVGIDMVAGPSEVLIIADKKANAGFLASDLLAQAEHDRDAIATLVTTSAKLAESVKVEINDQLEYLKTKEIAREALNRNGFIVVVDSMNEAIEISNRKAPEHLELQIKNPEEILPALTNYGGLFIGENAVEALGDYCAGPNHTLPTSYAARYTSGLSVKNFVKLQTTLRIKKEGINSIGNTAITMAEAEGLDAHAKSIEKRLSIKNGSE